MELNQAQKDAIEIAIQRYKNNQKYTVISGWAGTGKSTTVRYIIAALAAEFNIDPETDVCYCAFTGKACTVLQSKGNKNVSTLHRLLYEYKPNADGTFFKRKRDSLEYKIIVVDEVSMISKDLIQDLHRHTGIHIIYLGDSFQLPPIDPKSDNHLLDNPHRLLTQIMRQEEGNEIIELSTAIREGKPIERFIGKDIQVLNKDELNTGMLEWADIVLCATNAKRNAINKQMRQLLGFEGQPQNGEKIICKRNYWDIASQNGDALVNGTIGYLENSFDTFFRIPPWISDKGEVSYMIGDFKTEEGDYYKGLEIDKKMILTEQPCLDWKTSFKLSKNKKVRYPSPMEFYFGYAITCHASQGSQWNNVLVIEENFPREGEEHARWLYTAVTRSVKKLVLIRP